jgi:hypothetical protein
MVCFKYCIKRNTNFMIILRKRQLYRFRDDENVFDLKLISQKNGFKN